MTIYPSAKIRQDYNSVSKEAKETKEPIHLTKNGERDLVVMDIEAFYRREKMLKLREELLNIEEERIHGMHGLSEDEAFEEWDSIIEEM